MSGHTIHNPEKLEFKVSAYDPNRYLIVIGENSKWLMSIQHNGEQVEARQIANMRRLVACWNACQDVDTETLEAHPAPFTALTKELDAYAKAADTMAAAHKVERDALKDAARLALVFVEHVWRDVSLNEYSEDLRFKIEAALRAAL